MESRFVRAGVSLAAISVDTVEELSSLADSLTIRFPVLSDEGLKSAIAYGIAAAGDEIAVPSVFIVDRSQTIRFAYVGESVTDRPSAEDLLERAIEVSLSHKESGELGK
jgi:peroxiredoxin